MAQELDKTRDTCARASGPDQQTLILAAVLLSEEALTDEQIAKHFGIARRTLARWKNRDDMRLALSCLYRLHCRELHRRSGYWWSERELGPKTPDAWTA